MESAAAAKPRPAVNPFVPNTTPTPDCLFDELLPVLDGTDSKIVFFLARQTYGWRRPSCRVSYSQFARGIGVHPRWVRRRLAWLVEVGLLSREKVPTFKENFEYLYSLNVEMDLETVIAALRAGMVSPVIKNVTPLGVESQGTPGRPDPGTPGRPSPGPLGVEAQGPLGVQAQANTQTKTNKSFTPLPPYAPSAQGGGARICPGDPPPVQVRKVVGEALSLTHRPTRRAIQAQAEIALGEPGATVSSVAEAMIAAYRGYLALAAQGALRWTVPPDKFFASGMWRKPEAWPREAPGAVLRDPGLPRTESAAERASREAEEAERDKRAEAVLRGWGEKWVRLKCRQNSGIELTAKEKQSLAFLEDRLGANRIANLGTMLEAV